MKVVLQSRILNNRLISIRLDKPVIMFDIMLVVKSYGKSSIYFVSTWTLNPAYKPEIFKSQDRVVFFVLLQSIPMKRN